MRFPLTKSRFIIIFIGGRFEHFVVSPLFVLAQGERERERQRENCRLFFGDAGETFSPLTDVRKQNIENSCGDPQPKPFEKQIHVVMIHSSTDGMDTNWVGFRLSDKYFTSNISIGFVDTFEWIHFIWLAAFVFSLCCSVLLPNFRLFCAIGMPFN